MKKIFSYIRFFYDKLYFSGHSRLHKQDSDSYIEIILFISFCQSNNILTLFNLLFVFTNLTFGFALKWFYFFIFALIYGINYYHYEYKGNKNTIVKNKDQYYDRYTLMKALLYLLISSLIFLKSMIMYIDKVGSLN